MADQALISVKIRADVYRKVRTVAAWQGKNVSDYLSETVDPIADRDLDRMDRERRKDQKEDK